MDENRFDSAARAMLAAAPRRAVLAAALSSALVTLEDPLHARVAKAKKKKKKKKRCKGGASTCGRSCCGPVSRCRVGNCFCTGNEPRVSPGCLDVGDVLIELISEETGIPPGTLGANPQEPLVDQVTIGEAERAAIDALIQKTFLVEADVPYYTEGIAAGAAVIVQELTIKG